jgi:hypothetical protein
VDIDESKFSGLKYGHGEAKKSTQWVFGGKERISGDRSLVEVIKRRGAKTLIPLIQKWILPVQSSTQIVGIIYTILLLPSSNSSVFQQQ